MFPRSYFPAQYFAAQYFPGTSTQVIFVMPLGVLSGSSLLPPVYPA